MNFQVSSSSNLLVSFSSGEISSGQLRTSKHENVADDWGLAMSRIFELPSGRDSEAVELPGTPVGSMFQVRRGVAGR